MKKFCGFLLSACVAECLTIGALADVVWSPVAAMPGGWGSVIAVIAVVIVTIFLLRRSKGNK